MDLDDFAAQLRVLFYPVLRFIVHEGVLLHFVCPAGRQDSGLRDDHYSGSQRALDDVLVDYGYEEVDDLILLR